MRTASHTPRQQNTPAPTKGRISHQGTAAAEILQAIGATHPDLLTTRQASDFLTALGIPTAASSLEVARCRSRGPKYKKIGGRVYYTSDWLSEYAAGIEVRIFDPSRN
jgi:hypothetical protein